MTPKSLAAMILVLFAAAGITGMLVGTFLWKVLDLPLAVAVPLAWLTGPPVGWFGYDWWIKHDD